MTFRILLVMLALLVSSTHSEASVFDRVRGVFFTAQRAQDPTIRVLLMHKADTANIEVVGPYTLENPATGETISSRVKGKARDVVPLRTGLKWGEEFPELYQLKIVPNRGDSHVAVNGVIYQGAITIYDVGDAISIVNEVPIEEYIISTLATRVSSDLPEEALAAIVITARTDAYYQSTHGKNQYWDVDAQAVGYNGQAVMNSTVEALDRSADATRYMVMTLPSQDAQVTLFPAKWERAVAEEGGAKSKMSTLTVNQATTMAKDGANAAQILAKVFPNIYIQRIFQTAN